MARKRRKRKLEALSKSVGKKIPVPESGPQVLFNSRAIRLRIADAYVFLISLEARVASSRAQEDENE